jgi:conjugal transfer pilin signal peptidase TrbI
LRSVWRFLLGVSFRAFCTGKEIGVIKAWSKKTEPLSAIQSGIIPSNKFFAYTTHKDSFDSRYNDLGLIDAKDIIGTAIVAF